LDKEPTDTFVVQAENYIEDRDEDLLELRQINHNAIRELDDDEKTDETLQSASEPEKHETHLAAIYEEVADLRSHVRPLFDNHADRSSENQRMSFSTLRKRLSSIIVPSISSDQESSRRQPSIPQIQRERRDTTLMSLLVRWSKLW